MPTVRLLRIASTARLVSIAALASACAVTHETTAARVQLDEGVAKAQASALEAAVAGASAGDGVSVADAIARIGDTASALVPQTKRGAGHRPSSGSTTCACDASAKRCSFAGCTIRGAVVRGALSWGGGRIVCSDLEVDVAEGTSPVGTAHATLACDLTFDASHVAGTVRTTGSATVAGATYAWDATLTANHVTIAAGSFTGGSLDAQASVSVTDGADATKDYAATAEVALP
jgi:hypothetical protein